MIRDIILSGRYDHDRVLYIDAEKGDWTLGSLVDCHIVHLIEAQKELRLAHPWQAYERIITELSRIPKEDFPYDLVVIEGTSLIAHWCDDKVVSDKGRNELSTIEDHRLVRSRMLNAFYLIKWLPCNKIVTARVRNDQDRVEVASGVVTSGGDHFSPLFIPSLAREFFSIWDIVTRFEVKSIRRKSTLLVYSDHDGKGVQKDRFGTLPGLLEDPQATDILDLIETGWKEVQNSTLERVIQ